MKLFPGSESVKIEVATQQQSMFQLVPSLFRFMRGKDFAANSTRLTTITSFLYSAMSASMSCSTFLGTLTTPDLDTR